LLKDALTVIVMIHDARERAGTVGGKPFFRQYGPDLTGLFLSDAGAFGYKAEAILRLIKTPPAEDWASYNFEKLDDWSAFMAEAGRMGLACELFGFDQNLQRVCMERTSLMSDVSILKNVITGQKSLLKGLGGGEIEQPFTLPGFLLKISGL
jgi:hypothetical protein